MGYLAIYLLYGFGSVDMADAICLYRLPLCYMHINLGLVVVFSESPCAGLCLDGVLQFFCDLGVCLLALLLCWREKEVMIL